SATLRALSYVNALGSVTIYADGRLDANGHDVTAKRLADPPSGAAGDVQLGTARLFALHPPRDDATFGGLITGAGQVIKGHSGKQHLAGNNTYTGTTS